jgi:type IV secretion system protein VirD4
MKNVISKKKNNFRFFLIASILSLFIFLYVLFHFVSVTYNYVDRINFMDKIYLTVESINQNPFQVSLQDEIIREEVNKSLGKVFLFYLAFILLLYASLGVPKGEFAGIEHGSASWAGQKEKKKFSKKSGVILGHNLFMNIDTKDYNLNQFIVGGSGSGKTFRKIKPDILQANSNYVVVDVKGEIYRDTSNYLRKQGYEIRVLNLIDPRYSMSFNPFMYIKDDKDILILAETFMKNTENGKNKTGDSFWYKAEFSLLQSLMFYVYYELPTEECSFNSVIKMLTSAIKIEQGMTRDEIDAAKDYTILDALFDELEERDPSHIALPSYKMFKLSAGETCASIFVGLAVRFSIFTTSDIKNITSVDEMNFDGLAEGKKIAIYLLIPDTHRTFDSISAMFFSQLFQHLIYCADFRLGGSVKRHLRVLMDEFVNCGYIPAFDNIISTIRSRNISTTVIIQELNQLKAKYKDNWQTIIGCCDTLMFMGSLENETREYISKMIGKTTVQANSKSFNFGSKGGRSESINYIQRELMLPDELRTLPEERQIVLVRGLKPIYCCKYQTEKTKLYAELSIRASYKEAKENKNLDYEITDILDELKRTYQTALEEI